MTTRSTDHHEWQQSRPPSGEPATDRDRAVIDDTLVEGGFLRSVSQCHVVDAMGTITPRERSSC